MSNVISGVTSFWGEQKLTRQFLFASAAVFIAGMSIVGAWTSGRIESGVTQNSAVSTALYFESFIAPIVQDLAHADTLPAQKQELLARLISTTPLSQRVVSFKIWRQDGVVVYATQPELIGKSFPATPKFRQAWAGQVAAELDHLNEEENRLERAEGIPLLEVYAPIRQENSDRIIAVAEFYERADQLRRDVFQAKLEGWLIIGAVAVSAVSVLFGIVGRASRTIDQQKRELEDKIAELQMLLTQNVDLRARVERSSQRALEINERHLRRLGAELHDGPAQLLGLALLRLDAFERAIIARQNGGPKRGEQNSNDGETIRTAIREALNEIRNISVGLSLPSLDRLTVGETLQAAVRDHVRRTNTGVEADISVDGVAAIHPIKTAAFRFVQEALNNATRHASGVDQKLRAYLDNETVVIEVSDQGRGFDPAAQRSEDQIGLAGMRERIESLGGEFAVQSTAGTGTRLKARLPLNSGEISVHV
ncbi:MAG TPA: ATP-binding protein [Xanthobacteraceae bacterium]|nr:ATP-binding protein [Xanthobacteraceae bacterium]